MYKQQIGNNRKQMAILGHISLNREQAVMTYY